MRATLILTVILLATTSTKAGVFVPAILSTTDPTGHVTVYGAHGEVIYTYNNSDVKKSGRCYAFDAHGNFVLQCNAKLVQPAGTNKKVLIMQGASVGDVQIGYRVDWIFPLSQGPAPALETGTADMIDEDDFGVLYDYVLPST